MFSNWKLPPQILAEKNEIYAGWHFWICCRYYTVGSRVDAPRNLVKALQFRPLLLEHPEKLVELFYGDAMSPRVRIYDPIQFVSDVFDHLPPELNTLSHFRSMLLSKVYSGLAIRSYVSGSPKEARHQLGEALRLAPVLLERPADFVSQLSAYMQSMPGDLANDLFDNILRNLPSEAQLSKRSRSRLLAAVSITRAFKAYSAGLHNLVPKHVFSAIWKNPTWLKKRSVIAVFIKSLRALPPH